MIFASEFIKKGNLKALITVFFNITKEENEYILIESSYRKSKYASIDLSDKIREENNSLLNSWSGMDFELIDSVHVAKIKKDDSIKNIDDFITRVYKQIQKEIQLIDEEELLKYILLALFSLRGSADFTTSYYAVDVPKVVANNFYYEKLLKFITNTDVTKFNFNFRELQKDYSENNKKRNSQIRINLDWFYEKCCVDLESINKYKYNILKENKNLIKYKNDNYDFIKRIAYYKNNILNKLDKEEEQILNLRIKELRKELGFNTNNGDKITRSIKIVKIADALYDDECVSCKEIYDIDKRTFKRRNNDRYYLEIHHVISFASDKQGSDQIDNLVKLCPACHKALTPNRAHEKYQKEIIERILSNSDDARRYVENFLDNPQMDEMIDFVYNKLK